MFLSRHLLFIESTSQSFILQLYFLLKLGVVRQLSIVKSPEQFNNEQIKSSHKIKRGYGGISLLVRKNISVTVEPKLDAFIESNLKRMDKKNKKLAQNHLSKTTMFSLRDKESFSILVVVLHLKNPKKEAQTVFNILKEIISKQKSNKKYSYSLSSVNGFSSKL